MFQVGDVIVNADCTERRACVEPKGDLTRESMSCNLTETSCENREGVNKCYCLSGLESVDGECKGETGSY